MPTPTRIVVHFDDGTTQDINVSGISSVFLKESAAVKCGHRPPYKQGPPPVGGGASTSSGGDSTVTAASDSGSCYWVNGVIVCP